MIKLGNSFRVIARPYLAITLFILTPTLAAFGPMPAQAGLFDQKPNEGGTSSGQGKPKRPPRLKAGEIVPMSRCQANPSQCNCPLNSRGIRYKHAMVTHYVCVNVKCPLGEIPRVRPTPSGSREGICVKETSK
jgi:hypothetical protein